MIISVVAAKNGISQMCGFYLATLYMYTFVGVSHFDHARDGDHISRNTCVHWNTQSITQRRYFNSLRHFSQTFFHTLD